MARIMVDTGAGHFKIVESICEFCGYDNNYPIKVVQSMPLCSHCFARLSSPSIDKGECLYTEKQTKKEEKFMKVEEATRTENGHPVIIYRTDMGGRFPVHGACYEKGEWVLMKWTEDGRVGDGWPPWAFNLDLTDWRKRIPWENLKPNIKYITRDFFHDAWCGWDEQPVLEEYCWDLPEERKKWRPAKTRVWNLDGLYIPSAPEDWKETLAKRPEDD